MKPLILLFGALCIGLASAQQPTIPAASKRHFLKKELAPHVLADPDYFCWGMSVLKWTDGKYHGYYARWPKKTGPGGWMTDCEIAHAISDKPEGPFKTVGVVIESRNANGWDIVNAHNPSICVENGKIHLYYISARLRDDFKVSKKHPYPTDKWMKKNRASIVRNRQCIGVATADNPNGPFIRAKKPVVVPDGKILKNVAVNPAVIYRNGQFIMIAKGDDMRKKGFFTIQFVGHSDKAEGPFTFEKKPIYDKSPTEDACLWYDQTTKLYHCIVHVWGKRDLAHLVSNDSYKWRKAKPFTLMKKQFKLSNGKIWKPHRVERPFVLTNEKGQAEWIYTGVAVGNIWGNIASPFPKKPKKKSK